MSTTKPLLEQLAAQLANTLSAWVDEHLRLELTVRPDSEFGLTALVDLALLCSASERKSPDSVGNLASRVRNLLTHVASPGLELPSPPAWGRHFAAVALDTSSERHRLADHRYRSMIDRCAALMISLGPRWRSEEVAYARFRLFAEPLPPLRKVPIDGGIHSLYELTHLVFYATDFGSQPLPERNSVLGSTAWIEDFFLAGNCYDIGLELLLSRVYMSGKLRPATRARAAAAIERWCDPILIEHRSEKSMCASYHPMMLTVLAIETLFAPEGAR